MCIPEQNNQEINNVKLENCFLSTKFILRNGNLSVYVRIEAEHFEKISQDLNVFRFMYANVNIINGGSNHPFLDNILMIAEVMFIQVDAIQYLTHWIQKRYTHIFLTANVPTLH